MVEAEVILYKAVHLYRFSEGVLYNFLCDAISLEYVDRARFPGGSCAQDKRSILKLSSAHDI